MEVRARPIQVELAKRIGVSEMTIVNWEKGRMKPIKQYLKRLEKILGDLPILVTSALCVRKNLGFMPYLLRFREENKGAGELHYG